MSRNRLIQSLKDVSNRQDINLGFVITQLEQESEISYRNNNQLGSVDTNLKVDGNKTRNSSDRIDDIKLNILLKETLQYLKQSSSSLDTINFRNNDITSKGIQSTLVEFLDQSILLNIPIKHIDLQNNVIDGSNLYLLLNVCAKLDSLESLNLSFNTNLGREGALYIADYIQDLTKASPNHSFKALYLNNCGFDLTSLLAIITSLSANSSHSNNNNNVGYRSSLQLQILELDRPVISECPQQEILDHLSRITQSSSSSLQSISLQYACINDWGIRRLTESLLLNPHSYLLKSLNLQGNHINIDGAVALAHLLQSSSSSSSSSLHARLEVLKLSYNLIGEEGCNALAKSLEVNHSLRVLHLRKCQLHKSLTQLAESLLLNTTLQQLSLFENQFNQSTCVAFQYLFDEKRKKKINQNNNGSSYSNDDDVLKTDFELYSVDNVYHVAELLLV